MDECQDSMSTRCSPRDVADVDDATRNVDAFTMLIVDVEVGLDAPIERCRVHVAERATPMRAPMSATQEVDDGGRRRPPPRRSHQDGGSAPPRSTEDEVAAREG